MGLALTQSRCPHQPKSGDSPSTQSPHSAGPRRGSPQALPYSLEPLNPLGSLPLPHSQSCGLPPITHHSAREAPAGPQASLPPTPCALSSGNKHPVPWAQRDWPPAPPPQQGRQGSHTFTVLLKEPCPAGPSTHPGTWGAWVGLLQMVPPRGGRAEGVCSHHHRPQPWRPETPAGENAQQQPGRREWVGGHTALQGSGVGGPLLGASTTRVTRVNQLLPEVVPRRPPLLHPPGGPRALQAPRASSEACLSPALAERRAQAVRRDDHVSPRPTRCQGAGCCPLRLATPPFLQFPPGLGRRVSRRGARWKRVLPQSGPEAPSLLHCCAHLPKGPTTRSTPPAPPSTQPPAVPDCPAPAQREFSKTVHQLKSLCCLKPHSGPQAGTSAL